MHERRTAEALEGMRTGVLGGEDVFHHIYSIEAKSVKKFVGIKWFEQCDRNNRRKKIPMVVVHQTGLKGDNDIIMIRRKDFISVLGGEKNGKKGDLQGLLVVQDVGSPLPEGEEHGKQLTDSRSEPSEGGGINSTPVPREEWETAQFGDDLSGLIS
jgi:hypothetical protein